MTTEKVTLSLSPGKAKQGDNTTSSFFLARMMTCAPSAQIFLAAYLAHQYHPILQLRHTLFCTLFPAYLLLANRLRFASNLPIRQRPKDHPYNISVTMSDFFSGSNETWFQRYMIMASIIGLVLPLITIFCAPSEVALLAAPHLFVLWCQIIGESLVMFNQNVNRYIALLMPLGFSVYRMNILVDWFLGSVSLYADVSGIGEDIPTGYALGLSLAGLNLVFWTYNLLVTLLLKITPEFLSEEKCEHPKMQVVSLPFNKDPVAKAVGAK